MNDAWSSGAADIQAEIDKAIKADKAPGTSFAEGINLNFKWGNKDAAAFHKLKAFASAVITDFDLSEAVKDSLSSALANGKSFRDWRKSADTLFDDRGLSRLSPWQAETIYSTESSMAYGAGAWAKQQEVADDFPYWEYSTADDERVRASHDVLKHKIFKATDKKFYPPLGFKCRCRGIPISKFKAQKRGITGPDTVTQEMQANLGNAEFIGDKIKSFEDWLTVKMGTLDDVRVQLIIEKIDEIKQQISANESDTTTTKDTITQ